MCVRWNIKFTDIESSRNIPNYNADAQWPKGWKVGPAVLWTSFCAPSWQRLRAKITKTRHCRKKPSFIFKDLITKHLHVNLHSIHHIPSPVNPQAWNSFVGLGPSIYCRRSLMSSCIRIFFLKFRLQLMLNKLPSLGHQNSHKAQAGLVFAFSSYSTLPSYNNLSKRPTHTPAPPCLKRNPTQLLEGCLVRNCPFLSDFDITYFLKQGGVAKDQSKKGLLRTFQGNGWLTHPVGLDLA